MFDFIWFVLVNNIAYCWFLSCWAITAFIYLTIQCEQWTTKQLFFFLLIFGRKKRRSYVGYVPTNYSWLSSAHWIKIIHSFQPSGVCVYMCLPYSSTNCNVKNSERMFVCMAKVFNILRMYCITANLSFFLCIHFGLH